MKENISFEFSAQIKAERELKITELSYKCKKLPAVKWL